MTPDEAQEAVAYIQLGWRYAPMPDMQARQFARLFLDWDKSQVRAAIDALCKAGRSRPAPAELAERLRLDRGVQRRQETSISAPSGGVPMPDSIRKLRENLRGARRRVGAR